MYSRGTFLSQTCSSTENCSQTSRAIPREVSTSFQDKDRGQIFLRTLETLGPHPAHTTPLPCSLGNFQKSQFSTSRSLSDCDRLTHSPHYFCNSSLFETACSHECTMRRHSSPLPLTTHHIHIPYVDFNLLNDILFYCYFYILYHLKYIPFTFIRLIKVFYFNLISARTMPLAIFLLLL